MDLIRELAAEYSDYLRDESRTMGHAESISFPKTEEDMVAVVKYCYDHDILVNIQGARTGLAGGASPLGGHILNLSRMTKILGLRHDAATDRYYLRVQPGVLLSQVRKALENKAFDVAEWDQASLDALAHVKPGQLFFSPDPTETTASIGGMASCNASGARSFLYGATRLHINALRVVLADGSVTALRRGEHKAKGRDFVLPLVGGGQITGCLPDFDTPHTKDAGYYLRDDMDMVDLFMGSQGTLGIISELEISLMDAPKLMWGVTAFFPLDQCALDYIQAVRGQWVLDVPRFDHRPASIEFFNKHALTMILKQKEKTAAFRQLLEIPEDYECAVYVEFNETDPDNFLPVLSELSEVISAVGGDPSRTWVAKGPLELEKLLFFRHTVPETIDIIIDENKKNEPCITLLSTDMSVSDEHFEELFYLYRNTLEDTDLHWIIFGHAGENHFHPNIMARNKAEYEQGHQIFKNWAREIGKMGGTITAEHGAGKIKRELALIQYGEENMAKLRQLKRSLDPKYLLSPGNILSEEGASI